VSDYDESLHILLEFNKASTAHMHLWQDDSEVYCLLAHF